MSKSDRYTIVDLEDVPTVECPCGQARRAFVGDADQIASLHIVDIKDGATAHYHKKMTEIYYVLEGTGEIELDGQRFPIKAGSAILIKPGCRHRAMGPMRIINVPIPAFDPDDEWFD